MFAHIDINSYFATMLQQENPKLRNKPIGVVKDIGRTCVIAASKEAKAFGVKTGMRVQEAKRLCPQLITAPAEFSLYAGATRSFLSVLDSFSPDVEVFSLDEAFIPYSPIQNIWDSPKVFGEKVQDAVKKSLGSWVTCNVGVGRTRFLAKMAGETAPKGSITVINTNEHEIKLLASTSFEDSCGIGPRLARKLHHLHIHTPLQILFYQQKEIEQIVGPYWVKQLFLMAKGDEPDLLQRVGETSRGGGPVHSVSRSITLFKLSNDKEHNLQILQNLGQEVFYKLRSLKYGARYVAVSVDGSNSLGFSENQHRSAHTTRKLPITQLSELTQEITTLYLSLRLSWPVIRFRVVVSLLQPLTQVHPKLYGNWVNKENLTQAVISVQQKHGLYSIQSGRIVGMKHIQPEVTGYMGDKQFFFRTTHSE